MSPTGVEQLQRFMFQDKLMRLDSAVPGGKEDGTKFIDTLLSDVDIEGDVVEKVFPEQIKSEIWDTVIQVLKDDRKVQILKLRYIWCDL